MEFSGSHWSSWVASFFLVPILYFISIAIFNVYFHPLARFPGPRLSAISHIWHAKHWIGGRWPYDIEALHKSYGDVVRVAPDELSFATVQSMHDIYSYGSKFNCVPGEASPEEYRTKRRILSHGFSAKALKGSQKDVVQNTKEGINMSEWYKWLAFDIIGDLTFGISFGAVEQAKSHDWVEIIMNSTYIGALMGVFKRVPILKLLTPFLLPNVKELTAQHTKHLKLSQERVEVRKSQDNTRDDFFSHVLSDKKGPPTDETLISQANTLIIAGSETTTNLLTSVTFFLLQNPEAYKYLIEEIRSTFDGPSEIDGESTLKLPFLFAIIEEGLRLFPPVAFGLPRLGPDAVVDGNFVPAGTTVSVHAYTLSRSAKHFAHPHEFRPERFLPPNHPLFSRKFANDNKDASKPFSVGSRACLGVSLAYMEMRVILAKMAWCFDWELVGGGGNEGREVDWERDTRLYLVWEKPAVWVRFVPVENW